MYKTVQEVITHSTYQNGKLFLPGDLDRKVYLDVMKQLGQIGGAWKRNSGAIEFDTDVEDLIQQIRDGEPINLRKEYQFFETPYFLAKKMIADYAALKPGLKVLEPSAGKGALIKVINAYCPSLVVSYCEIQPINNRFLDKEIREKRLNASKIADNFFDNGLHSFYDRIIANPPFASNQDIDHIRHMYKLLKPGGRIVTVASAHWQIGDNKKEKGFRQWITRDLGAEVIELPAGTFQTSGTNVKSNLIIINK